MKSIFNNNLLYLGILFFLINAYVSFIFYHANSYKLVTLLIANFCLLFFIFISKKQIFSLKTLAKTLGILFLPTLGVLPGLLIYRGTYNTYLPIELATNLLVILWAYYIYYSPIDSNVEGHGDKEEKGVTILLIAMGITTIYTFICQYFHIPEISSRLSSTFGNKNYFACFLSIMIPLYFTLSLNGFLTKKKIAYFYLLVFLAAISAMFTTACRTGIVASTIAVMVACFIFFLKNPIKKIEKTQKKILLVSILLIAIVFIMIGHKNNFLFAKRFTELFRDTATRTVAFNTAIKSIKEAPLLGYGIGSSYDLYFKHYDKEITLKGVPEETSYNHVHNELVEYMQEGGVVGLIIFISFWVYIFYLLHINFHKKNSKNQILSLALAAAFFSYHLHSLFDVAPRMVVVKLPLYTLIGITLLISRDKMKENRECEESNLIINKGISLFITTFITICSVVLILPWMIPLYTLCDYMITQEKDILILKKVENTLYKYPNVYALYELGVVQLKLGRFKEATKSFEASLNIIPKYKDALYLEALSYYYQQDFVKAKEFALKYQQQDLYEQKNLNFLIKLAVTSNDFDLFFEVIKIFCNMYLVNEKININVKTDDLTPTSNALKAMIYVYKTNDSVTIIWDKKFLFNFLNFIRDEFEIKKVQLSWDKSTKEAQKRLRESLEKQIKELFPDTGLLQREKDILYGIVRHIIYLYVWK
ncbi:MAG: O-antigen ligase family protein [Oligoflexia bacterium]|nr:O-antigen ligase family protein [Oligoflexia bacterium]